MHNIAVDAVVVPAGGHGDEKPVRPFNHFNVVQGDCIVQRDGYDCAQPAVMQQSADLYISDVVLSARPMCVGVSARNLSLIGFFYIYTRRLAETACVLQQKGSPLGAILFAVCRALSLLILSGKALLFSAGAAWRQDRSE